MTPRLDPDRRLTNARALRGWQVDAAQLLEEHHLVAWAHEPGLRTRFGVELAAALAGLDASQVCVLHGAEIRDLYSFCAQLEHLLGLGRIKRKVDAPGGVIEALRSRDGAMAERPSALKRRFLVWLDADVLLREDHRLFGRLVDAIAGVSAEAEYHSEDLLLIQRAIFVGGPSLDVYAEDPRGQFACWHGEGSEEPLWKVVTGLSAPKFLRYHVQAGPDA